MKRLISLTVRPGLIGLMIIFSLILTSCAASAAAKKPSVASTTTGSDTVQSTNNPKFGQILVNAEGRTLYTFSIDTSEASGCTTSACTGFWPPYTVSAQPTSGPGITGSLGTITRSDGSTQVTYDKKPLYTFALDKQPGDTKGDGLDDFGGIWHVVTLGSSSGGSSSNSNSGSGGYHY